MATHLKSISPILWTKNLEQTILFYRDILGFSAQSNFPNFVSLCRGDVEIMFVEPQAPSEECLAQDTKDFFPAPSMTGNLYFVVTDVDELWNAINQKVKIKTALEDREYYMRDFSILDNNGYELVFGQNIGPMQSDRSSDK